jgi:hypothetical protein
MRRKLSEGNKIMAETEMVRVAALSEAERVAVNALTPFERKVSLVHDGQVKMRNADKQLFREHLDRIRSGEVAPQTNDIETGRPYPTNGQLFYYQNDTEPMEDIGRVPGHDGMHVLKKRDGSLFFTGGYNLREEGERWEDFLNFDH